MRGVRLQMSNSDLLKHLCELEVALHQSEVRSDRNRLDKILHESFVEFGRSGREYFKTDILEELPMESEEFIIYSRDFSLSKIEEGVALLTYKSAHINPNGDLSKYALRSSLWQHTELGWQMRFHQGTSTDAFEKVAI